MYQSQFVLDPELCRMLDAATPNPDDWVLYCPSCNFIGQTNAALAVSQHNPPCGASLRIWKYTPPHLHEQREGEEVLAGFEHWLSQSMFQQADDLLRILRIEKCSPAALLAVLAITFYAKDKLQHRDDFLARVEALLISQLGAPRAAALLANRR